MIQFHPSTFIDCQPKPLTPKISLGYVCGDAKVRYRSDIPSSLIDLPGRWVLLLPLTASVGWLVGCSPPFPSFPTDAVNTVASGCGSDSSWADACLLLVLACRYCWSQNGLGRLVCFVACDLVMAIDY